MNQKTITIIISDKAPTLKEAQRIVEGFVERVKCPDGRLLLVNEEGRLRSLPFNPKASMIAQFPIVGNVIVLEGKARNSWR